MRLAIATVLLVERRICKCGRFHVFPSSRLLELQVSPEGEPYSRTLVEITDNTYPATHVIRYINTSVDACQYCFNVNADWLSVENYRPPAPKRRPTDPHSIPGLRVVKEPTIEELAG